MVNKSVYPKLSTEELATLKECMRKHKVWQNDVARALGISQASISAALCGKNNFRPAYLAEIYNRTGRPEELGFILDYLPSDQMGLAKEINCTDPDQQGIMQAGPADQSSQYMPPAVKTSYRKTYLFAVGRLDAVFAKGSAQQMASIVSGLEDLIAKNSNISQGK